MHMKIALAGPGRAGMAVALALLEADHSIVAVTARRPAAGRDAAQVLDTVSVPWGDALPGGDLLVIAVRDDAIAESAFDLSSSATEFPAAVHLSGAAALDALDALGAAGLAVGSFHPLQTIPGSPATATSLRGAWVGITASTVALAERLRDLATSIGAVPFDLDDEAKPRYHAAAAAAANFPLAALAMAEDLFRAAGVPFEAARPLVDAVVANAFELGPRAALTGPVARGDLGTVVAQVHAVDEAAPEWAQAFRAFVAALASMSGREDDVAGVIS
jgi:predicted short-subunit dehydrogenase-like oxidoreductase (DUF2520 family)